MIFQKHQSYVWEADELVAVDACLYLFMALVGAGMEVVDDMHAEEIQGVERMSGDVRTFPECKVIH